MTADAAIDYASRLAEVKARIHAADAMSGRLGSGVRVLVATKTADADAAAAAVRAGARLVGESRMQELDAKGEALKAAGAKIHVIGQLQRNKAAIAVRWADCVQTVDSLALAERLSRLCVQAGRDLDVMIQVNVSGEPTKAGVDPAEALELASAVQGLPALTVTGFMTIGLNSSKEAEVRACYARLTALRDEALVRSERGELPLREAWELSMGMSGDLEWAVAEGATMVRVGTAVMGQRPR
ncbi:YggS family pyridoxal phosphate-dependent enzyme [Demequina sp. TTPB684]|uniref:YggS family pyridoxal phosphate-dependent enzyme n=1 Tax=unclassified Demequina TaxID=2620311 RepID=UPI001CF27E6A|nr:MULTISPECIES: YggS family pyridoxal phosphate-dependent enzyme [unclassified Demequina]MCB2412502.1 YggS family pyridoxal phosphate-dependent enzyme [Demequina sp. TTPB684]UPU88795.1 YggS family pyridoxal phosphate-dependent enzyme [Demequina sp. TMPB413]